MYIQEIIIDGFKSYAHRTTVEGFDPHFNAITGLNGSGKSNILDSICFVLGITNLSQVRAGNLSELVYKQGQAGINKATVTIVFNNQDSDNSPVGYEQCPEVTVTRQVLLGGKSKYLINGKNAPAGQVQNLFHSVQLNVNNPHFLIMQGRITKVLNMKPNEILGMIEEAAGTRMYETKRVNALKTIEKKQAKLDELNTVLAEEITPTLERLRNEKQNYLKWSKNSADIERLDRFVIAYAFERARKALESNTEGSEEMERKVIELDSKAAEYKQQIEEKDQEIADRTSKIKGNYEEQLSVAKKKEQCLSNDLVRITSAWKSSKENLKNAESDLKAAEALVEETLQAVSKKESLIQKESSSIEQKRQAAMKAEEKLAQLTLDYQNMCAGISSSQGDEGRTLPEQISKANSDSKAAEAKVKQAEMKISHLSKELQAVEKQIQKEGKSASTLEKKKDSATKKVSDIKEQLRNLGFTESEFTQLEEQKDQLEVEVTELSERVDTLSTQLKSRLSFRYSDPVRGFDRSKVKGLVANLINVKDHKFATALEVVAGGKLFQVVVDEAITGKALLDRGKLERRVTIIPLDKIQPRQIADSSCQTATEIAGTLKATAQPAIELIGFDEEVRGAIEYVFGSTIVVDDMKAANQICDAIKTRTVTLDGDVYDPSGTISGGSKNQLGSTLAKLIELTEAKKALELKQSHLRIATEKYTKMRLDLTNFEEMTRKLDLAETELQAVLKQLSQTNFGMLVEKRDSMRTDLEAAEAELTSMAKERDDKWALFKELQEREVELTKEREDRLAAIEKAVKETKTVVAKLTKVAREAEAQSQTQALELGGLKDEVLAAKEAVRGARKALEDATLDESDKQMEVGRIHALFEESRQELEKLEQCVSQLSSEISDLKHTKTKITKALEAAKLESKKLSVQIDKIRKERVTAEKEVSNMLKKYSWIESEKSAFGVQGGDYDFENSNPKDTVKLLNELKAEQEVLAKKINKKVMGMIEKAEGEYTELLRKRKVVENDKKKIQNVISELDEKKKTELQRTWVKVNRDFGSVFSTLLPGASAKLEPPEGMEAWEGLEVKVAFGDVWKESLSELSGGQRSLLALSLILSLLLFKPAPMYILDEVDAALDLSHTQNIGNMLKTHFSQSQFIVVSLKEGMFNNANVIFRTKFVDGVSQVTRTLGTGLSRPRAINENENIKEYEDTEKTLAHKVRRRGKENVMG